MRARSSRLRLFLLAAAAAAALMLLYYDAVLVGRVMVGEARHLGSDVIAMAYMNASFCAAAAALLASPLGRRVSGRLRWPVVVLCVTAALVWLVLHGGGFVYSHESMFRRP